MDDGDGMSLRLEVERTNSTSKGVGFTRGIFFFLSGVVMEVVGAGVVVMDDALAVAVAAMEWMERGDETNEP